MTYKILAGRRLHKFCTRPCHTGHPSLLLLINSNLPTLCLMHCGSGWPVHCRPLPSVLQSRFNLPPLGHLRAGLRATLTPAGHIRYFYSESPSIPINPCNDPHTGVMIKM